MRLWKLVSTATLAALAVAACSDPGTNESLFKSPQTSGGGQGGQSTPPEGEGEGGAPDGEEPQGEAGSNGIPINPQGGGTPENCSNTPADVDSDEDGFTPDEGDLNDCDPNVNPGALDVVNYKKDENGDLTDEPLPDDQQVDEDGDGVATLPSDPPVTCDGGLGPKIGDPADAARAMGLCNFVEENPADPKDRKWGVIEAKFSDIAGAFLKSPPIAGASTDLQLGILPDLGPATVPYEGESLFALSSGIARAPGQDGFQKGKLCSGHGTFSTKSSSYPPGFPKNGTCGESGTPNDAIALDLRIRVPTNAKSFKFNFRFFTCEYPTFVCGKFNDVFAVLMAPSPLEKGDPMADATNASANVAFEATESGKKNVIGVNNESFLSACKPGTTDKTKTYTNCQGEEDLAGSGFEGHGASGWLESQVPIPAFPPGADRIISLRFAIWDSNDKIYDSSVVVDNFRWSAEGGTGVSTSVVAPPQ